MNIEELITDSVAISEPIIEVQHPPMDDAILSELRAHPYGVYRVFMIYKFESDALEYYGFEKSDIGLGGAA